MTRKPRIYYVHLWRSWFCSTGVGLPGEPGEGATPKEAFIDWYIKQIGCDESIECQPELL